MPWCSITGCSNNSQKSRLFRIPRAASNVERTKLWLKLINRPDLPLNAKICEAHFSQTQFENARKDGRKLLKPEAFPDLLTSKKRKLNKDEFSTTPNQTNVETDADNANNNFTNNDNDSIGINLEPEEELEISEIVEKNANNVENLKKKLKAALRKCRYYEKKLQQKCPTNLEKIFNHDQLEFLETNNCRGHAWSDETITKALKLYMACGTKGYEEIRKQYLPYPSPRTLQHRIRNLKFKPGILDEVFKLLELKLNNFKTEEKHATLIFDEMAIRPGLQYDNTMSMVVGWPTLKLSNKEKSDKPATHALTYMLGGVSTRWKQIVGYDFTGSSFSPEDVFNRLTEIIQRAYHIGVTIQAVISDMGPQNQSIWKMLNIVAGQHCAIRNFIQHPCNSDQKLLFTPDPVHVFKNLAVALTKGYKFIFSDLIVQKYKLPCNEVSIEPIRQLHAFDKNDLLKICPRLKDNVIAPSHFDKMNVSISAALISHDVAAGLLYYIADNKIDERHRSTAWFVETMHKWFKVMTGRCLTFALSKYKEDVYAETIDFLKSVQELMYNVKINNKWMPFQSGILLSTQTALDFQELYLEKHNFQFVLLSRLTQDALENSFSSIRVRQPVPDARLFKVSLRLVCLSQFETTGRGMSYKNDEANYIVQYCGEIQAQEKAASTRTQPDDAMLDSLLSDFREEDFTTNVEATLYYLLGSIIYKIKKNFAVCDKCFKSVQKEAGDTTSITNFTKLKEFKENLLIYPTMDIFNYVLKIEKSLRLNENALISNSLSLDAFIQSQETPLNYPMCHNIISKITKLFVKTRIYFLLSAKSKEINSDDAKSSRSMAMRAVLKK